MLAIKKWNKLQKVTVQGGQIVDLRSDTVTQPCDGMRKAMTSAKVGDDVLKEDPTITELENKMAMKTGKEAGLFVASGTMGNLLSVLTHCTSRGSEAILGSRSHIYNYEQANIAQFGGIQTHSIANNADGTFNIDEIEVRSTESDFHSPTTELICIEDTHCGLGGRVLPLKFIDELSAFCKEKKVPLHMDGARIFNASVASGVGVDRILQGVDSASICLSKGLGCPVGSIIVGNKKFISRAQQLRKALGGGWRQAGMLAACGIYALENNVERLADDHEKAKRLAKGINEMNSANALVHFDKVDSNMVLVELNPEACTPQQFAQRMLSISEDEENSVGEKIGIKAFPMSRTAVRLVCHLDVSDQQIDLAIKKLQFLIKEIDSFLQ